MTVDVRATGCLRCAGRVRVRVAGRWRPTPLRATSGGLRATTGALPRGRLRLEVALEDRATGLTSDVGSNRLRALSAYGRVIAPSEADETSFAYLARTPVL